MITAGSLQTTNSVAIAIESTPEFFHQEKNEEKVQWEMEEGVPTEQWEMEGVLV